MSAPSIAPLRLLSSPAMNDAAECAALVRRHAHTFALASRLLPEEKRRAAFAVYAFCRVADDLVDESANDAASDAAMELGRHRLALVEATRGQPHGALFRELAWAVKRYDIPTAPFHALVSALHGDLAHGEMHDWPALERYCIGVASTVGIICAHVFGLPRSPDERDVALQHAATLGVALQLTNILRDVGEDAARGRCYLPTTHLAAAGISRDEILARALDPRDRRWQSLMRDEIARARGLYDAARPGVAMLHADARRCADLCARGYAAILDAIEQRGHDSLTGRARVSRLERARLLLGAWRTVPDTAR